MCCMCAVTVSTYCSQERDSHCMTWKVVCGWHLTFFIVFSYTADVKGCLWLTPHFLHCLLLHCWRERFWLTPHFLHCLLLHCWRERLSVVDTSLSSLSSPTLLFQPEFLARPCPAFLPLLLWTAWFRKSDCCSVRVFVSDEALDIHPHGWGLQLKIRCSLYPVKKKK